MSTPASIARHPVHPILVTFPIGLWVFSLICDVIALFRAVDGLWNALAFYTMIGGVVGALLAAVPGFIDWRSLTTRRVQRLLRFASRLPLAFILSRLWRWIALRRVFEAKPLSRSAAQPHTK